MLLYFFAHTRVHDKPSWRLFSIQVHYVNESTFPIISLFGSFTSSATIASEVAMNDLQLISNTQLSLGNECYVSLFHPLHVVEIEGRGKLAPLSDGMTSQYPVKVSR